MKTGHTVHLYSVRYERDDKSKEVNPYRFCFETVASSATEAIKYALESNPERPSSSIEEVVLIIRNYVIFTVDEAKGFLKDHIIFTTIGDKP